MPHIAYASPQQYYYDRPYQYHHLTDAAFASSARAKPALAEKGLPYASRPFEDISATIEELTMDHGYLVLSKEIAPATLESMTLDGRLEYTDWRAHERQRREETRRANAALGESLPSPPTYGQP